MFALHDRFATSTHGVGDRVDAALKFSEAMLAAEPGYLKAVPQLDAKLKSIMAQNRNYLAHEYFNREWNCMYFTDVVDALASTKLDYATSASPLDSVDAIHLKAEGLTFLQSIDHPVLREQTRDYFVNQQFRKDLYIRGAIRLSTIEQRERMLDTRFVLTQPADLVPSKVTGALGEADLQKEVYGPLITALAAKSYAPKSLRQLAVALPDIEFASVQQALIVLVGMTSVAPCQSEAAEKQTQTRCAALNFHLCERSRYGNEIETLASPVTGGGIAIGRFHQIFLLSMKQGKKLPSEWGHQAAQLLADLGQRIVKEGKTLETAEENLAELTAQAVEFSEKHLPLLKALRIA